jgi:hypothetical protein
MKSTLDLRPVYHRIEPRICAHVLLCWLALLLIRVAERRTELAWRRIAIEMGRIHTVTLAGTVTQTTPLTEIQQGIVDACGVPTPRVTPCTASSRSRWPPSRSAGLTPPRSRSRADVDERRGRGATAGSFPAQLTLSWVGWLADW